MANIAVFNNKDRLKSIRENSLNPVIQKVNALEFNQDGILTKLGQLDQEVHNMEAQVNTNTNLIIETVDELKEAENILRGAFSSCKIPDGTKTIEYYHKETGSLLDSCDLSPMFAGITEQGVVISDDTHSLEGVKTSLKFEGGVVKEDPTDPKKAVITVAAKGTIDGSVGSGTPKAITGVNLFGNTDESNIVDGVLHVDLPDLNLVDKAGVEAKNPKHVIFKDMSIKHVADGVELSGSGGVGPGGSLILNQEGQPARSLTSVTIPSDSLIKVTAKAGDQTDIEIPQFHAVIGDESKPVKEIKLDDSDAGYFDESHNSLHIRASSVKVGDSTTTYSGINQIDFPGTTISKNGDKVTVADMRGLAVYENESPKMRSAKRLTFKNRFQYVTNSTTKSVTINPFVVKRGSEADVAIKGIKVPESVVLEGDYLKLDNSISTHIKPQDLVDIVDNQSDLTFTAKEEKVVIEENKEKERKRVVNHLLSGQKPILTKSEAIKFVAGDTTAGNETIKAVLDNDGFVGSVSRIIDPAGTVTVTTTGAVGSKKLKLDATGTGPSPGTGIFVGMFDTFAQLNAVPTKDLQENRSYAYVLSAQYSPTQPTPRTTPQIYRWITKPGESKPSWQRDYFKGVLIASAGEQKDRAINEIRVTGKSSKLKIVDKAIEFQLDELMVFAKDFDELNTMYPATEYVGAFAVVSNSDSKAMGPTLYVSGGNFWGMISYTIPDSYKEKVGGGVASTSLFAVSNAYPIVITELAGDVLPSDKGNYTYVSETSSGYKFIKGSDSSRSFSNPNKDKESDGFFLHSLVKDKGATGATEETPCVGSVWTQVLYGASSGRMWKRSKKLSDTTRPPWTEISSGKEEQTIIAEGYDVDGTYETFPNTESLIFDERFLLMQDSTDTSKLNIRLRHEGSLLGVFQSFVSMTVVAALHKGDFNKGQIVGLVDKITNSVPQGYTVYSWNGPLRPTEADIKKQSNWNNSFFLPTPSQGIKMVGKVPTNADLNLAAYKGQFVYCTSNNKFYYSNGTDWIATVLDGSGSSIRVDGQSRDGTQVKDFAAEKIQFSPSDFYLDTSSSTKSAILNYKGFIVNKDGGTPMTSVHGLKLKGAVKVSEEGTHENQIAVIDVGGIQGKTAEEGSEWEAVSKIEVIGDPAYASLSDGELILNIQSPACSADNLTDLNTKYKPAENLYRLGYTTDDGKMYWSTGPNWIEFPSGGTSLSITGKDPSGAEVTVPQVSSLDVEGAVLTQESEGHAKLVISAENSIHASVNSGETTHITELHVDGDAKIEGKKLSLVADKTLFIAESQDALSTNYPPDTHKNRLGLTTDTNTIYLCSPDNPTSTDYNWYQVASYGDIRSLADLETRLPDKPKKMDTYVGDNFKQSRYAFLSSEATSGIDLPEEHREDGFLVNLYTEGSGSAELGWVQQFHGSTFSWIRRRIPKDSSEFIWGDWERILTSKLGDHNHTVLVCDNYKVYKQASSDQDIMPYMIHQDPSSNMVEGENSRFKFNKAGSYNVTFYTQFTWKVYPTGASEIVEDLQHYTLEIAKVDKSSGAEVITTVKQESVKPVQWDTTSVPDRKLFPMVKCKVPGVVISEADVHNPHVSFVFRVVVGNKTEAMMKNMLMDPYKCMVAIDPASSKSTTAASVVNTLYRSLGGLSFQPGYEVRVQEPSPGQKAPRVYGVSYSNNIVG